jgi:hypothetical protein
MQILALWLVLALPLFAETGNPRTLGVLPTSDTSEMGIAEALQTALGQLAQESGLFTVEMSNQSLTGFTKADVTRGFQAVKTECMAFVYMERARVSVFLFDSLRPGEFILAFEMLSPAQMNSQYIESQFRSAWSDAIKNYTESQFQPLPGSAAPEDPQKLAEEEGSYKAAQARKLFRELAALEERNLYAGAAIGMARFAAKDSSASTVNFGGTLGARLGEKVFGELGLDVFSYCLLNLSGRFNLPVAEKYLSVSLSLGLSRVMGAVTNNRGFKSTNIRTGSFLAGPGFSFDIPLLGANLRGDLRFYVGSATVLLGTYGIVYAL